MDATNLKVAGPCELYFDKGNGNGERALGHTLGGVELSYEPTLVDVKADKFGDGTVYDKILNGEKLTAKCMLAEATKKNLWLAIQAGNYNENGTDSKLEIGRDAGYSLRDNESGQLRIHPISEGISDRNSDVYLYKCVSVEAITVPYKNDEQEVYEVTLLALPDESNADGNRLGRIGDPDIS